MQLRHIFLKFSSTSIASENDPTRTGNQVGCKKKKSVFRPNASFVDSAVIYFFFFRLQIGCRLDSRIGPISRFY